MSIIAFSGSLVWSKTLDDYSRTGTFTRFGMYRRTSYGKMSKNGTIDPKYPISFAPFYREWSEK